MDEDLKKAIEYFIKWLMKVLGLSGNEAIKKASDKFNVTESEIRNFIKL